MKNFKNISISFVVIIVIIFCCNIFYLVTLYSSIKANIERDVITALANADVDDMWERAERSRRKSIETMEALIASGQEIEQRAVGGISGIRDDEGNFVTTSLDTLGDTIVKKMPLRHENSYTNQMVDDMSRQMHASMDGYIDFDLSIMDSVFSERLADRGIYPKFVGVEIVDSLGKTIQKNTHLKNSSSYDEFQICFNPTDGLYYRAYISPLTRQVFREMAGVIITVFLLMIVFSTAFWYLYWTVSRLRSIEEMKDDFVSNMTHELKTPIAIAYSANDALLNYDSDNNPAKRKKYLTIANKQLKRLGELVENILAVSMERRKTMTLKPETIELRSFVEELASIQRLRKEKDITIIVDINKDSSIITDKVHFANVLNNLIDNAIKYSGNKVIIKIKGNSEEISIRDNGIGIPAKLKPFLFNKFYRVPHGNRQDVRGYGIGLYYVKSIADKMGWTITLDSTEGEGTDFIIKFRSHEK